MLNFGETKSIQKRDKGRALSLLPHLNCPYDDFEHDMDIDFDPENGPFSIRPIFFNCDSIEWECLDCRHSFLTDLYGRNLKRTS